MDNQQRNKLLPVKDFDGYFVSSEGYVVGKRNKILSGKITWDGYREIILSEGKKRRSVRIHILIAEHFLTKERKELVINHKDGNKLNNNLENLEYVTGGENQRHYQTMKNNNNPSNLKKEDFDKMLTMYKNNIPCKVIKEQLGLSCRDDYISEILSGRKLSEISGFTEDMRFGRSTTRAKARTPKQVEMGNPSTEGEDIVSSA